MTDMTGAELKVSLTGLGLTPGWLASRLGVSARTVIRWCDQKSVPRRAVGQLRAIERHTDSVIEQMASYAADYGVLPTERTDVGERGGVQFLNADLPASWHRALTYRALRQVRSAGLAAAVTYRP